MSAGQQGSKFATLKLRIYLYVVTYGVWALFREIALRGMSAVVGVALWTVLLPVSILLHLLGYRRLTVLASRIGHFAAEVDCLLKQQAMDELPHRKWLLLAPPGGVANQHLLQYWKMKLQVVENPFLCFLLRAMSRWWLMKYDVSHYILRLNETADAFQINARWSGRPPIIGLSAADKEWGKQQLRMMGLPENAWFVCIHIREAGFSPADEVTHAHRNGRPDAVIPAMMEIVSRGGYCIRMGDPSMTRLPDFQGVIDYAHHPLRSPRLDVVMCGMTRFFLGNSSGLAIVSSIFGVPSAIANMIPLSAFGLLPADITIHKLHKRKGAGDLMSFAEILGSDVGNFRYARLFGDAGIEVIENSPEEILDLVNEMLDRLEGRFEETSEYWASQHRFMKLLHPGHYSYGTESRIGAGYLRKYHSLLGA